MGRKSYLCWEINLVINILQKGFFTELKAVNLNYVYNNLKLHEGLITELTNLNAQRNDPINTRYLIIFNHI